MANYANQKTITITNMDKIKHIKDSGNRFAISVDFKYEAAAMMRLNGNAYKLWRYLLCWDGKGFVDFSPAALKQDLGFGKNAPSEAFNELLKLGYLQEDPNVSNKYIFIPVLDADYQLLKDNIK